MGIYAKHAVSGSRKFSATFIDFNTVTICVLCYVTLFFAEMGASQRAETVQEPPEGYYAFVESPNAEPPRVRRPPYLHSDKECLGIHGSGPHNSLHNLCGDLNKGFIPRNPMGQKVLGAAYPFELVRNKTLEFFSKTLPILKADETLPRVAKYRQDQDLWGSSQLGHNSIAPDYSQRNKREADNTESENATESPRESDDKTFVNTIKREARKFCENGGGVFCMLYRAFNGEPLASGVVERRDDFSGEAPEYRRGESASIGHHDPSLPPTPCPAKVDYATPVFAKNYQGVWRYVVQIPYEGYFTQTVEVTRCLQSRCHYLEGGCLSSPRWTSLLVAEIYYPDTFLPAAPGGKWPSHRNPVTGENPPPVHDFQNYQQYLRKRAGVQAPASTETPSLTTQTPIKNNHCDGVDDIGCFQVRLYYDWFLIPGSCKCWRPDYFSRFIRRKVISSDL
ncbi:uncharacterized protein spz6 [Periplaneta americana]|uniref:uncharacterized protein spz6 n=1 Tax=Periplaneta americana TaxID=6978 RepID=UPI0037E8B361